MPAVNQAAHVALPCMPPEQVEFTTAQLATRMAFVFTMRRTRAPVHPPQETGSRQPQTPPKCAPNVFIWHHEEIARDWRSIQEATSDRTSCTQQIGLV